MNVLVLEDDAHIAALLVRGLGEEGHAVTLAQTLSGARVLLEVHDIDALIVDRTVPDGDGLHLIRELRARGDQRPALVLTARDQLDERVEGLYGGADDYITKPFVFDELLARLAAVARRAGSVRTGRIVVGDLVVDTEALRVWRDGQDLQLTAQEFRLLRQLAEHTGHVQTRTRLLEAVWDLQDDPGSNVVDVYVSYLRAKVDKGRDRPLIHTVRGLGYVLEDRG